MKFDIHQSAAINSPAQLILCPAPPGSGKTAVLVSRIRRLISEGVEPREICAITFTNAGALELSKRIQTIYECVATAAGGSNGYEVGDKVRFEPKLGYCGTLHSFCLQLLRSNASLVHLPPVSLMDEEAAEELLEQCRIDLRVDCTAKDLKQAVKDAREDNFIEGVKAKAYLVAERYFRQQRITGVLDFDSVLRYGLKVVKAMRENGAPAWKHLLVDEYQDSAPIDNEIYSAMRIENGFYVGDADQNIFAFRGTTVMNMLKMSTGAAAVLPLKVNYRSASFIVQATQRLIKNNSVRIMNESEAAPNSTAGLVAEIVCENSAAELAGICSRITDHKVKSVAVLFRTNSLAKQAADYIGGLGIKLATKPRADEFSAEEKLGLATLDAMNGGSSDLATLRFIRMRYGQAASDKAKQLAIAGLCTVAEACTHEIPVVIHARTVLSRDEWEHTLDNQMPGLLPQSVKEWMLELAQVLPEPFSLSNLIAVANQKEEAVASEGVYVGTVHSAKGREWDVVFMAGCEASLWPGRDEIEEARRLFYVGCTRARLALYLSWCKSRQDAFRHWVNNAQSACQFVGETVNI